ncbi:MAG: alpha/beta hydrolase, partial [Bacteroidota bacterium]
EMIPQCVQGMLTQPVWEQLNQIRVPGLIVYGSEDALIPNRILHSGLTINTVAKQGLEAYPNSRLKMIHKAGHFVHWEQAAQVNLELEAFLKEVHSRK